MSGRDRRQYLQKSSLGIALLSVLLCEMAAPASFQRPTFRTSAPTVAVWATVRNRERRFVRDLPKERFRIVDEGRDRPVTVFSSELTPVTVCVMLDMSVSMSEPYSQLREAALAFVSALEQDDRVRIGTFGWEISVGARLTNDKTQLARVLREELWWGGFTPLWQALSAAMNTLEPESGRRVVLVFTDGNDRGGLPGWTGDRASVERTAVQQDVMIHAVGFKGHKLSREIVDLADRTGGGHVEVPLKGDLTDAFVQVADELRHQYLLGFSPERLDDRMHTIRVEVVGSGLKVRARTRYWAGVRR